MKKLFGLSLLGLLGALAIVPMLPSTVNAQAAGGGFGAQNAAYNPDVPGSSSGLQGDKLITGIKNFINRILGLLALISLGILLYGGFQMVTAAGDDGKYKEGMKILKQAGFGLAFIGLAWLMISLIFYIIKIITG